MTPYSSCVPRPLHAFVASSMKYFAQKAWSISSHDAYRSLRHNHSTGIDDVIALKEAPSDQSIGLCANLPSAKSLGSEGAQAAVLQAMNARRPFDCQIYTPPRKKTTL